MSHLFTFVLFQKETKTGVHIFLEDTSANGTFINGEKVGKLSSFKCKCMSSLLQKETSTGVHVFLEDSSSNGTFINGEKVGKVTCIFVKLYVDGERKGSTALLDDQIRTKKKLSFQTKRQNVQMKFLHYIVSII